MKNPNCPPLLLEQAGAWCAAKWKQYQIPAAAGILLGFLAYMFAFTNKLVNHDDVSALFSKGGTHSLGRWGLDILEFIFPNYSMPWIYGIVTIVLITLSACIILHIFSIRSKVFQVLLVGCVLIFPSLIGTFTYMFTSSSYGVAFVLAVLAVEFLTRQDKISGIFALLCMIASLSIYQSYVAITASLLVLTLIQRLLREEEIEPVVKSGIGYVFFLILSLGLYYLMTMVVNRILGAGFSSYASGNMSFRFLEIPSRILLAYQNFPRFFTEGFRGLIPTEFSRLLHMLCLLVCGMLLLLWGMTRKKLKIARIAWLIALLAVLPLAINCMYLFTTEDSVHTLVLYSFVAVYVFAAFLADSAMEWIPEQKIRHICVNVLSLLLALILICNIYLANEAFLLLHLRYENANAFYSTLIADIRMTPGFDENTQLAIIGNYREPSFYLEKFPFSDHVTGTDGFLPDVYSKDRFLEYYLGFPMPMASETDIAEIMATSEFQQMPVYPYYGSLQLLGNTLVVKLS